MKESIMSFFHAPVTNKVPAGVCNLSGLHTYLTSDKQLEQLTHEVRATLADGQLFRKKKQQLLPYVTPAGIFPYCDVRRSGGYLRLNLAPSLVGLIYVHAYEVGLIGAAD